MPKDQPEPLPAAIPVRTDTRLSVSYTYCHSSVPLAKDKILVIHHGILHTRDHFHGFIRQLNAWGFHVAMIDQQSQYAAHRERIGLGCYATGMSDACRQIEKDLGMRIGGFVYHSMGAAIGEEMQGRPENKDLRRPTSFMTPIPVLGSWPVFLRLLVGRPLELCRAIAKANVLSLVDRKADVKKLFLDNDASDAVVMKCRKYLMHAPFGAYLELTFRFIYFFSFRHNRQVNLLLTSNTDHIFACWEYGLTRWRYRLSEERADKKEWLTVMEMGGGHDIFLADPEGAAVRIAFFFHDVLGIPKSDKLIRMHAEHVSLKGPHMDNKEREDASPDGGELDKFNS